MVALWLPRFATDRLRRRLESEARPLVTAAEIAGRQVVLAVDALASAAGVVPGQPLADARALGLRLAVHPAAPASDAAALERLADWCGRYTPWVAVAANDAGNGAGLWLDVTGCAHLFGGEAALVADLVRRLGALGYTARAGLADTPGAAWAVARFAAGDAILSPGGARAALAPLPVAALRLTAAATEGLERLGLRRIGDLYPLPRAALARRFGAAPAFRLDQALGRLFEPISPRRPPARHRALAAFAEPLIDAEGLAAGLARLIGRLCRDLDAAGSGARRLDLVLYRVDGSLRHAAIGTSRPNRDPAALVRLFAEPLQRLDPGFGVEAMTLEAPVVEPLSALQLVLDNAARPRPPTPPPGSGPGQALPRTGGGVIDEAPLAALVDRLGNRFGFSCLYRMAPHASHLPERATAPVPALSEVAANDWPDLPPRPVRLLAPPEPVEAESAAESPPLVFRWNGQAHRVVAAEGPERIAPEWWREAAATRDYFRVEDEEGRRFWLYREAEGGRWRLHGLFG